MGIGYSIRCKKCGYEGKFLLGVGMMHLPENLMNKNHIFSLLDLCPKEDIEKVDSMMNSNYTLKKGYGYEIYECPSCNKLYNNYDFTLVSNTNPEDTYTPHYLCEDCKTELVKKETIDKCPKCGEPLDIASKSHMLWD